jgi:4-aminobutyrate aminotransferase-like enzyme
VIVSTCGPDSSSIRLSPPLVVGEEHVRRCLGACRDALPSV